MEFKSYYTALSAEEKRQLAERLSTSVAYLSQLASGHRNAGAHYLLNIEEATGGQVTPRELRPDKTRAA